MASTGNDERVTLRTWLLVVGFVAVGILLLYLSDLESIRTKLHWLSGIMNHVGGLFLVSAAVAIAWDLVVKRRFMNEILAKTRLSHDISGAGLSQVTDSFHGDVDWRGLLSSAKKIDMFFAYASTLRNNLHQEFNKLSDDKNVRIRVVFPDLENQVVLKELSRRFGYSEEKLVEKVNEAIKFFDNLQKKEKATVEIWLLPYAPVLTYYRFDNKAVIATYSQQQKRTAIPTFVCERNGSLYAFVRTEFQAMIEGDQPLARKKLS